MIKCNKCWSNNIIWVEIFWAYDWVLYWKCEDCKSNIDRHNWKEIKAIQQDKMFWPAVLHYTDWTWKKY